jgi:flagellar biosynthesis protein FliR
MFQDYLLRIGLTYDYTREMITISLILVRTMVMIFLTPFFGGKIAPSVVKMGLGGLIAVLLWPVASGSLSGPIPVEAVPVLILFLKEMFIGLVIGFVNMEVFFIMEMAGRMIDTMRGTSMSEVLEPHSQHRQTPVGDMYYQLLLVFFMAIGGHNIFLEAYSYSFKVLPLDGGFSYAMGPGSFVEYIMRITNETLMLATLLALPVGAATFITDIVFGLLNRVAPQLNAYFMAMPVKAMAGVALVFVTMEPFVARSKEYIVWSLHAVEHSIELLGGKPLF